MADAPEKIWVGSCAALGAPDTGFWYPVRTPSTPTTYIRADLVDELRKALEEARRDARNAWGAVTSNQVEDKDVAGGLRASMDRIDAALARIDALKETING